MAVLPQSGTINIQTGVIFAQQPGLTWYINKDSGRIEGEVDGWAAVKQAVEIILNVERFRWQIYLPSSGMQWEGLIGQDPGYVSSEVQRLALEALTMDDRVTGISDFSYTMNGNDMTAYMTVNTVFGPVPTSVEVTLN